MARLETIVAHIDRYLNTSAIPDYPGALNGLQLASSGPVRRVAAAVDASLPVVTRAVDAGADLLLVHHGMFWNGPQPITGAMHDKLKLALDHNLAVYSVHIPLDIHPVLGNNALLSKAIRMTKPKPFFEWKGIQLGLAARMAVSRDTLAKRVEKATGFPVHLCPGGRVKAGRVGVITGGAGSEVAAIAAAGIDTFITGEGPHWSYTAAEELGINVLYGGHYATETFGVRALAEHLAARFKLKHSFIDHPTGL